MTKSRRNSAFSLTEVLIAAGLLAMGFMLLFTLFPLGLKLTAKSTEATVSRLTIEEAVFNARQLLKSDLAKRVVIPTNRYIDFRTLYWNDKNSNGVINDSEDLFVNDNDNYELDYSPYLFLYPTASNVADYDKKFNASILIGHRSGDFAEIFIFASRRISLEAQYPAVVDSPLSLSNRPQVLTLPTAENATEYDSVPNTWLKINTSHNTVLDDIGLGAFVAAGSEIVVHKSIPNTNAKIMTVVKVISPHEDGNHYLELSGPGSWKSQPSRSNFGDISFVPPAVGSGRSAAVGLQRRTVRINYE